MKSPFRYFDSSPEVIRLVFIMYVRYPLSLLNVEDLFADRGIDVCHETVRLWWTRFGPMFAAEVRKKRVDQMRAHTHWRWHIDEVYVKINREMHYLWRAVDHEGEVLESFASKTRDKAVALRFIKQTMKRHGKPKATVLAPSHALARFMTDFNGELADLVQDWLDRIEKHDRNTALHHLKTSQRAMVSNLATLVV
jgi:putative transposase